MIQLKHNKSFTKSSMFHAKCSHSIVVTACSIRRKNIWYKINRDNAVLVVMVVAHMHVHCHEEILQIVSNNRRKYVGCSYVTGESWPFPLLSWILGWWVNGLVFVFKATLLGHVQYLKFRWTKCSSIYDSIPSPKHFS